MAHPLKPIRPQTLRLTSWEWCLLLAITGTFLAQGCTERPSSQIDSVIRTLQDARLSGAQDYAYEQLQQAEMSYNQAINELDNQDEKFAWWRSYSQGKQMLDRALAQADQAKSEALANLEETKSNAQVALILARQNVQDTQTLLMEGREHPSMNQQFEELHTALQRAEALLDTIESGIMSQGDYIQVMTTAHAVETITVTIQQRILSALDPSGNVQV
jgi:outer membrane murein-binding lipoprotein Lpp